eukprot:4048387-Prymnesium_polylepis.1
MTDGNPFARSTAVAPSAALAGRGVTQCSNPFAQAPASCSSALPALVSDSGRTAGKRTTTKQCTAAATAVRDVRSGDAKRPETKRESPLVLAAAAQREEAAAREAAAEKKRAEEAARRKGRDRCCGIAPWHGCLVCIALGILASVMGSAMLALDHFSAFAVACCLDAIFNIGAFMFLFGPRKYCRGAFTNGLARMCAALVYWSLIALTIALCFVPGVTKWQLVAALLAMKIAWAINLAAACGCLGGRVASKEAERGRREAERNLSKATVRYCVATRNRGVAIEVAGVRLPHPLAVAGAPPSHAAARPVRLPQQPPARRQLWSQRCRAAEPRAGRPTPQRACAPSSASFSRRTASSCSRTERKAKHV